MFFVKCLVDDKHLATVLHRLAGIANNVLPVPVSNVKKVTKSGKVETTGENLTELVWTKINGRLKVVTNAILKETIVAVGKAPGSSYWVTKKLLESGRIVKVGAGKFNVIPETPDAPTRKAKKTKTNPLKLLPKLRGKANGKDLTVEQHDTTEGE